MPDGPAPDYRGDPDGDSLVHEAFKGAQVVDGSDPNPAHTYTFTAADYGWQDDFQTDIPPP